MDNVLRVGREEKEVKPVFPTLRSADVRALDSHGLEMVRVAKNQPQYIELPAVVSVHGLVTTRWALSWAERLCILLSGNIYLQVLSFGKPLQPVKLLTKEPSIKECQ